jgi:hypothetical protein
MTDKERAAHIAALQARRAARGMSDPLNVMRAVMAASPAPAIVEIPAPHVLRIRSGESPE